MQPDKRTSKQQKYARVDTRNYAFEWWNMWHHRTWDINETGVKISQL